MSVYCAMPILPFAACCHKYDLCTVRQVALHWQNLLLSRSEAFDDELSTLKTELDNATKQLGECRVEKSRLEKELVSALNKSKLTDQVHALGIEEERAVTGTVKQQMNSEHDVVAEQLRLSRVETKRLR